MRKGGVMRVHRMGALNMLAWLSAGTLFLCLPGRVDAAFPAQGDDVTSSMGRFEVWVRPQYRNLVGASACFDQTTGNYVSPLLFDSLTRIGRSSPFADGSATDTSGAPVGTTAPLT